ncbi:MAG: phosphomannomutase/phosphoglucomutase [Planctomycetota bacterium]
MLGKVFKAYDVRGTYPDPLNEKMAWQIGFGCASYLLEDAERAGESTPMMRHLVVGHDMRTHSPSLRDALVQGVLDGGGNVIDVGKVDTPFVYFAINHLDCAGGVQVTASHNPPQYNGFKVSKRLAKPVGEQTGLAEVRKAAATVDQNLKETGAGHSEPRDLWDAYTKHVLRSLDLGGKSIKVVVDASNGMAGTMVPKVFGKKGGTIEGLEIVELYFENSKGEFVHEPNPLVASNLRDLQEKVLDEQADFGICFDGDADRLMVVDERGQIVGCDHLSAFLAGWFLEKHPGASIVYDLRSSKALEEEIRAKGGTPIRSRVGHVFMKALMAEHGCVFGGELSGHFYFRSNFNADSGAIALATVLTAAAHAGKPMSELINPFRRFPQSGERNFEVEDKDAALEELKEHFDGRGAIDELDGVTIDCFEAEGWWCNVRKSNTEPLLRLNVEARSDMQLSAIIEEITPMLGTAVAH